MISKERRSGVYHLSAYYLAKTVSELPLVLLQPSLYLIISYWIVGLNGPAAFFGTWFVLVTNSIAAQVSLAYIMYFTEVVLANFKQLFGDSFYSTGSWISDRSCIYGF